MSTTATNGSNCATPYVAATPLNTDFATERSEESVNGEVAGTPDQVKLADDATSYASSGHWTSILDGVCTLFPLFL